eukprot:ctg_129.g87
MARWSVFAPSGLMEEPGLRVIAVFDDDAQAAESTKKESPAWRKNVATKNTAVDMVCSWGRRDEARDHLRELVTRHVTAAVRRDTSGCLLLCASSATGDDVLGEILLDALEAATVLKTRAFSLVVDDFTVADDGAIGGSSDRLRALADHGVEELRRSSSLSLSNLVAWITTAVSRPELRPPWCTGISSSSRAPTRFRRQRFPSCALIPSVSSLALTSSARAHHDLSTKRGANVTRSEGAVRAASAQSLQNPDGHVLEVAHDAAPPQPARQRAVRSVSTNSPEGAAQTIAQVTQYDRSRVQTFIQEDGREERAEALRAFRHRGRARATSAGACGRRAIEMHAPYPCRWKRALQAL